MPSTSDGDEVFREVIVDHLRFLNDVDYRERMRGEVATLDRGSLTMIDVEHEHDDACCRMEPWGTTLPRLFASGGP